MIFPQADILKQLLFTFWRVLVQTGRIFTALLAHFAGKASPVHFVWGSFDLAATRKGGAVPLAAAIFAPIAVALVLQSRQFALRAPANRGGPAKALS